MTTPDSSPGGGDQSGVVTEQVRQTAQDAQQATQQAVSQAVDTARQQATTTLAQRKSTATQTLSKAADALQQSSQQLQSQNEGMAAQAIDTVAQRLQGAAGYLENRDIGQLLGEAEDFTRRNTALVLGGAFLVGLGLARFLKSSQPSPPRRYGSGTGYSGYDRYGHGSADGYGQYSPTYGANDIVIDYTAVETGYAPNETATGSMYGDVGAPDTAGYTSDVTSEVAPLDATDLDLEGTER
jgi:hypothetical protein